MQYPEPDCALTVALCGKECLGTDAEHRLAFVSRTSASHRSDRSNLCYATALSAGQTGLTLNHLLATLPAVTLSTELSVSSVL